MIDNDKDKKTACLVYMLIGILKPVICVNSKLSWFLHLSLYLRTASVKVINSFVQFKNLI